eukprot:621441-Pleurochrysis_carterae.AAC.2
MRAHERAVVVTRRERAARRLEARNRSIPNSGTHAFVRTRDPWTNLKSLTRIMRLRTTCNGAGDPQEAGASSDAEEGHHGLPMRCALR